MIGDKGVGQGRRYRDTGEVIMTPVKLLRRRWSYRDAGKVIMTSLKLLWRRWRRYVIYVGESPGNHKNSWNRYIETKKEEMMYENKSADPTHSRVNMV